MSWELLVPILGIIFGVPFGCGIPLLVIWTEHKRKMALIERGLYQPKPPPVSSWRTVLMWGLILTCAGTALVVGSFWMEGAGWRVVGLVGAAIGIAFLIFSAVTKEKTAV